ncbi:hypothetical protein Hamer_G022795 [Homarus americanus]|uniref:Uncharacterized protein n=1 Tax=Homarus americanus TaxID=6706 RepID=A0A8J5JZE8_HOMAM|nr:hypothetical protein Hamer_G022795 [Homarus americanus]
MCQYGDVRALMVTTHSRKNRMATRELLVMTEVEPSPYWMLPGQMFMAMGEDLANHISHRLQAQFPLLETTGRIFYILAVTAGYSGQIGVCASLYLDNVSNQINEQLKSRDKSPKMEDICKGRENNALIYK